MPLETIQGRRVASIDKFLVEIGSANVVLSNGASLSVSYFRSPLNPKYIFLVNKNQNLNIVKKKVRTEIEAEIGGLAGEIDQERKSTHSKLQSLAKAATKPDTKEDHAAAVQAFFYRLRAQVPSSTETPEPESTSTGSTTTTEQPKKEQQLDASQFTSLTDQNMVDTLVDLSAALAASNEAKTLYKKHLSFERARNYKLKMLLAHQNIIISELRASLSLNSRERSPSGPFTASQNAIDSNRSSYTNTASTNTTGTNNTAGGISTNQSTTQSAQLTNLSTTSTQISTRSTNIETNPSIYSVTVSTTEVSGGTENSYTNSVYSSTTPSHSPTNLPTTEVLPYNTHVKDAIEKWAHARSGYKPPETNLLVSFASMLSTASTHPRYAPISLQSVVITPMVAKVTSSAELEVSPLDIPVKWSLGTAYQLLTAIRRHLPDGFPADHLAELSIDYSTTPQDYLVECTLQASPAMPVVVVQEDLRAPFTREYYTPGEGRINYSKLPKNITDMKEEYTFEKAEEFRITNMPQECVNLMSISSNGETILHYAALNNNIGLIAWLLSLVGKDGKNLFSANAQFPPNQDVPLHRAARKGNLEAAQLLIAGGANPNVTNKNGETPLIIASERGHLAVCRFLVLEAGASFAITTNETRQSAMLRAAMNGRLQVMAFLNACNMHESVGSEMLKYFQITSQHRDKVLSKCKKLPDILKDRDVAGFNAFLAAANHERIDTLKWLLSGPIKSGSGGFLTKLFSSGPPKTSESGIPTINIPVSEMLVSRNNYGMNAAHCAAMKGKLKALQFLHEFDAGWTLFTLNSSNEDIFLISCSAGHLNIVEWLVSLAKQNPLARSSSSSPSSPQKSTSDYTTKHLSTKYSTNGMNALHLAALTGHAKILQILLSPPFSMSPSEPTRPADPRGVMTPLLLAASSIHAEAVEVLVNAGADMFKERDGEGNTAMLIAAKNHRLSTMQTLERLADAQYEADLVQKLASSNSALYDSALYDSTASIQPVTSSFGMADSGHEQTEHAAKHETAKGAAPLYSVTSSYVEASERLINNRNRIRPSLELFEARNKDGHGPWLCASGGWSSDLNLDLCMYLLSYASKMALEIDGVNRYLAPDFSASPPKHGCLVEIDAKFGYTPLFNFFASKLPSTVVHSLFSLWMKLPNACEYINAPSKLVPPDCVTPLHGVPVYTAFSHALFLNNAPIVSSLVKSALHASQNDYPSSINLSLPNVTRGSFISDGISRFLVLPPVLNLSFLSEAEFNFLRDSQPE